MEVSNNSTHSHLALNGLHVQVVIKLPSSTGQKPTAARSLLARNQFPTSPSPRAFGVVDRQKTSGFGQVIKTLGIIYTSLPTINTYNEGK